MALIARLLAERTARTPDDYEVQLTAAAVMAVLFTASRRWAAGQGSVPFKTLVDQAVTTVEPLLARLEHASSGD